MHQNTAKNKPKPPRFNVGHKLGVLTITKYVGHDYSSKTTDRKCHFYKCKCDVCGEEPKYSQDHLTANKNPKSCRICYHPPGSPKAAYRGIDLELANEWVKASPYYLNRKNIS
jgi:hypothetical protein